MAENINALIDYPQMLIENDIQGSATLDLYFDHNGKIDETKSKIFGSHRLLRGLLTKASRFGLAKWYLSDALRLNQNEFIDQHFQANFETSYSQAEVSKYEKIDTNQYSILRRHYVYPCTNPLEVDVACTAIKTAALLKKQFSLKYKNSYDNLQETLVSFDELGLAGINRTIGGA